MKEQIIGYVRQIDQLNAEIANHWAKVQKCLDSGQKDDAILLLSAYFGFKEKVEGVEANLKSLLHSNFADK